MAKMTAVLRHLLSQPEILVVSGVYDGTTGSVPGGMRHVVELFHTMGRQDVLERDATSTSPPTADV